MPTKKKRGFNPEGSGFDYARARAGGMSPRPDASGTLKWGSTVRPSAAQVRRHSLPQDSYIVLKGAGHKTFAATVASENKRGSDVVKKGARYYSIPRKKK